MKIFFEIIKIQFSLMLQSQNFSKSKKSKGFVILFILVAILIYASGFYSFGMYVMLPPEYKYVLIYAMGAAAFMVIFVFSITTAQGQLFEFKDFDMLMSWPVSRTVVFTAKIVSFLCMMMVYQLFLILPALAVYGFNQPVDASFYLIGVICTMFLPLIPIVFSCVIALIVRKISGNGRFKRLFINCITVFLFLLILVGSFAFNASSGSTLSVKFLEQFIATTRMYLYPVYLFAEATLRNDVLSMVLLMGISVLIFVSFLVAFSKLFVSINSNVKTGYKVKNFKLKKVNSNSPYKTLIVKEFKKIFSNFMYFINFGIGQVFLVAGGVYLIFNKSIVIEFIYTVSESDAAFSDSLFALVCMAMFFCASMTATSCVSISLEGKQIWITKTIPIKTETILMSKVVANAIIIWIPTLIGFLLISFSFGFNILHIVLGVCITILLGFWIGLFGVSININFPKINFDREILVIKQSASSIIAVAGGMILGVTSAYIGFTYVSQLGGITYGVGLMLVLLLGDGLLWLYLKTKGVEKFKSIY